MVLATDEKDFGVLVEGRLKELETTLVKTIEERTNAIATANAAEAKAAEERITRLEAGITKSRGFLRQRQAISLPGVEIGRGESERFSFARAVQLSLGIGKQDDPEFGYEMEIFRQMAKKDHSGMPARMRGVIERTSQNTSTGPLGGFLVPIELMTDIIPELEAQSINAKLGVQQLFGMTGEVRWPREDGTLAAQYLDTELEATGTETTTAFSVVKVRPHVLAAFVPLTWEMVSQPAIAIDQFIRNRMAVKIALREDLSVFKGSGANSEPTGLLGLTGNDVISTVDWGTIAWGTDTTNVQTVSRQLKRMIAKLANANAMGDGMAWAGSPDAILAIGETKTTQGNLVFTSAQDTFLPRIMGYPTQMTTQLDDAANTDEGLILGKWNEMANAHFSTLVFAASGETGTNFLQARLTLRALMAHDIVVFHPKAFCQGLNVDVTAVL